MSKANKYIETIGRERFASSFVTVVSLYCIAFLFNVSSIENNKFIRNIFIIPKVKVKLCSIIGPDIPASI